jgi:hypothetical protein
MNAHSPRMIWATGILVMIVSFVVMFACLSLFNTQGAVRLLILATSAPVGMLVRYMTLERIKRARSGSGV